MSKCTQSLAPHPRDRVTIPSQCYCNHSAYSSRSEYILYEAALFCHSFPLLIICISVYLCRWASVLFVWKLYIWRRKVLPFALRHRLYGIPSTCARTMPSRMTLVLFIHLLRSSDARSFAEANWALCGSYMVNNIHNETTVTIHSSNFPSWHLFPFSQFVTTLWIIKCLRSERWSLLHHFTRDVSAVPPCYSPSHGSVWNAGWMGRKLQRDSGGWRRGTSCIQTRDDDFPPHRGQIFQTVWLLIPRACDIIGNWAPALRKHAGQLGRMWLKLRSACRRRAREKRVKNEHREAIVHAKSRCMRSLLRFVSEQDCNVPNVAQVQAGAESRVHVSLVSGSRLNKAVSNSGHLRWQVILL